MACGIMFQTNNTPEGSNQSHPKNTVEAVLTHMVADLIALRQTFTGLYPRCLR